MSFKISTFSTKLHPPSFPLIPHLSPFVVPTRIVIEANERALLEKGKAEGDVGESKVHIEYLLESTVIWEGEMGLMWLLVGEVLRRDLLEFSLFGLGAFSSFPLGFLSSWFVCGIGWLLFQWKKFNFSALLFLRFQIYFHFFAPMGGWNSFQGQNTKGNNSDQDDIRSFKLNIP